MPINAMYGMPQLTYTDGNDSVKSISVALKFALSQTKRGLAHSEKLNVWDYCTTVGSVGLHDCGSVLNDVPYH